MRCTVTEKARTSKRYPGIEWIGETGVFIHVDTEKCTGCGDCLKVCLADCFEIANKRVKIKNLNECMECASCWYVCMQGAIDFSWPQGGTGYRSDWG
jgi:NAD-dependent dihydropyrimidine dehydrogenase PreA subunit